MTSRKTRTKSSCALIILTVMAGQAFYCVPPKAFAYSIDPTSVIADGATKVKLNSLITLVSASSTPSVDTSAAIPDQGMTPPSASLSDVSHLLQNALAEQSGPSPSSSGPPINMPTSTTGQPAATSRTSLSDTAHLLQKALAEQSPAPLPTMVAPAPISQIASTPPAPAPVVIAQKPITPPPLPAPEQNLPAQTASVPLSSMANAKLTKQEALAVQSQASNQTSVPAPSTAARSALTPPSPATTVLTDEPKDKQPASMDNAKLTLQQEVAAQSAVAPSSEQPDAKISEVALNTRLTPSENAVKSDITAQWSEKLEILEQENIALRDKLQVVKPDNLSDIRMDVVTKIREDVLRARVGELEQEVNKLHMDKEKESETASAVPPVKASALTSKDQAIPPPPPGKIPAVQSKPLITGPLAAP